MRMNLETFGLAGVRRVLMTADTVGGVWTYAMDLTAGLGKRGIEVVLATMGMPLRKDQRAEAARLTNVEVWESEFKLEWMEEPWRDVERAGEWLLEVEEKTRPDLAHVNGLAHGALDWRAPCVAVGHSCVLSWWRGVKGEEAPEEWDCYRRMAARGLRAAAKVIAPSNWMLGELERYYGPLRAREVIPNGAEWGRGGHGRKEKVVLAAGRLWDEGKNVASLASAAARLPWPVCVAGDARPPEGRGRRWSGVRLLGRLSREEMRAWHERAAIFASPAVYEPFGLAALEAGGAGCALVLGDIPSFREIWGDAAVFVAPRDAEGWSRTLRELMEDGGRRWELGEKARRRARWFSADRMTRRYAAAYEEAMTMGRKDRMRGWEGRVATA